MRTPLPSKRQSLLLQIGLVACSAGLAIACVRKAPSSAVPGSNPTHPTDGELPSIDVDPNLPVIEDGPWLDASLPAEKRTRLLLEQLTENEKLKLVFGYFGSNADWKGFLAPPEAQLGSAGYIPGIPRLKVPPQWQTDAGMGVATQGSLREKRERTALPSGVATASTWNPELAELGGAMIGAEARASGFNVLLAGSVNLLRTGYCGRNFEYAGEDPYLAGVMVGAQIAGIQSNHIISTIKHFAVNDQETDRRGGNSVLSDRAARMSDLLAFEIAIERGKPGAVMCSYNRINGDYGCESEYLLTTVLREDWGYAGYVLSDWGAVHSTAKAANAGLEQQSGWPLDDKQYFQAPLKQALAEGAVDAARLDEMVSRILHSMFTHGLFDHPVAEAPIDLARHAKVSQASAEEGAVLLKNGDNVLPLAPDTKVIAIIGGYGDKGVISGGGSSQVYPEGGNAVPGLSPSSWPGPVVYYPSSPARELKRNLPGARIHFRDGKDIDDATRLARDADIAIVFATHWATESIDTTITLPGNQDALIKAVAAANPRTVVVLETGSLNLMPWAKDVKAILQAWYPGTAGGRAIARLLTGKVNPSGHLPLTIPRAQKHLTHPDKPKAGEVKYTEGATVGYKWFDKMGHQPLFEFGHGLSYTSFRHDGLTAEVQGQHVIVSFDITNTGDRQGKDVGQIYAAREGWEAPQRLAAFAKVDLAPGAKKRLQTVIDPRLLASWDSEKRQWVIAAGEVTVRLGSSSRKIHEEVQLSLSAGTIPPAGPKAFAPQKNETTADANANPTDTAKETATDLPTDGSDQHELERELEQRLTPFANEH